ncbi:GDSL esterase/lipase EXL1 [Acorus calamus]|uniref:GDSL esterase/lipase EXL1 n=1 Tax=Acorus calamus TaxID=4465 RepID=A0AAV9F2J0_ACOCL|nr:GDSL esterase/lipase EXL1 [Acorus calamus]
MELPNRTSHTILTQLLLSLSITPILLQAQPVPAVIVFGDSIVDPGNNNALVTLTKCNFPPYGRDFVDHRPTGRFSNGKIPTDLIASQLGVKEFIPAYLDPKLTIQDLLTGVSFASGGAGFDNLTAKIPLVMFEGYMEKVKAIAGENRAKDIASDSLYILLSGSNDLLVTYFNTPLIKTHDDLPTYIDFLVQSASGFTRWKMKVFCFTGLFLGVRLQLGLIPQGLVNPPLRTSQQLYTMGARRIGVVGVPPLGCVPMLRTLQGGINRGCVTTYNQASEEFNSALSIGLQRLNTNLPDAHIVYIDIHSTLLELIQHPSHYGVAVVQGRWRLQYCAAA